MLSLRARRNQRNIPLHSADRSPPAPHRRAQRAHDRGRARGARIAIGEHGHGDCQRIGRSRPRLPLALYNDGVATASADCKAWAPLMGVAFVTMTRALATSVLSVPAIFLLA